MIYAEKCSYIDAFVGLAPGAMDVFERTSGSEDRLSIPMARRGCSVQRAGRGLCLCPACPFMCLRPTMRGDYFVVGYVSGPREVHVAGAMGNTRRVEGGDERSVVGMWLNCTPQAKMLANIFGEPVLSALGRSGKRKATPVHLSFCSVRREYSVKKGRHITTPVVKHNLRVQLVQGLLFSFPRIRV